MGIEREEHETRDQYKQRLINNHGFVTSSVVAHVEKLKELEAIIAKVEEEEEADV